MNLDFTMTFMVFQNSISSYSVELHKSKSKIKLNTSGREIDSFPVQIKLRFILTNNPINLYGL